jgi:hypothetical protein
MIARELRPDDTARVLAYSGEGGAYSERTAASPRRDLSQAPLPHRFDEVARAQAEEGVMAVSDQLTRLAARAKKAEDRAAAAQGKARADLERDVENARKSAQAQADKLRATAEAKKGKLSVWWNDVQRSWDEHIERIRTDIENRRAEHDLDRAQTRADNAEDDAEFAVDYAYAAIEEAEYAVLDASLARIEADELAAASTSSNT